MALIHRIQMGHSRYGSSLCSKRLTHSRKFGRWSWQNHKHITSRHDCSGSRQKFIYFNNHPPGHGIFGAWAPTVGSKVKPNLNKQYKGILKEPWVLEIRQEPKVSPYFVEIENRPGGKITLWTREGPSILGRVIKPVSGSGRFQGTLFQDKGRIRANHPGVIDISTSPKGQIGGFQILPLEHAASREMYSAWKLTQWLIVAPYKGKFVGSAPLFSSYFVPGPARGEKLWDLWSTYGRKPLVLVRINGGKWSWMPEAVGKKIMLWPASLTYEFISLLLTRSSPKGQHTKQTE